MDASKEGLIQRLLNEGKITLDEAYLLRKEESKINQIPVVPVEPMPQIGKNPRWGDHMQDWNKRKQNQLANCSCNPENGGSGVCGCTLGSGTFTC
jgi:hypothetical protein